MEHLPRNERSSRWGRRARSARLPHGVTRRTRSGDRSCRGGRVGATAAGSAGGGTVTPLAGVADRARGQAHEALEGPAEGRLRPVAEAERQLAEGGAVLL